MPPWVIGAISLAIAVAGIFVAIGRLAERIEENKLEVDRLRRWRHEQENRRQVDALVPEIMKKIDQLEARLNKRR